MHSYTPNMLVKLIYCETDIFETLELENSIENDETLKTMYLDLKNGFKKLPELNYGPSMTSVSNILFYSQASSAEAIS